MVSGDSFDLDALPRRRLSETDLGDMPGDLAEVLDEWLFIQHGVASSSHGVGTFLDLLAEQGYRVKRIDPGPPFSEMLPPSPD